VSIAPFLWLGSPMIMKNAKFKFLKLPTFLLLISLGIISGDETKSRTSPPLSQIYNPKWLLACDA
jgi:hypothetical protein